MEVIKNHVFILFYSIDMNIKKSSSLFGGLK
jgi:hypothetical protein